MFFLQFLTVFLPVLSNGESVRQNGEFVRDNVEFVRVNGEFVSVNGEFVREEFLVRRKSLRAGVVGIVRGLAGAKPGTDAA